MIKIVAEKQAVADPRFSRRGEGGNQFGPKTFGKILAENWIKNESNWTEWGYVSLASCANGMQSP